jgi:hypothetical protein
MNLNVINLHFDRQHSNSSIIFRVTINEEFSRSYKDEMEKLHKTLSTINKENHESFYEYNYEILNNKILKNNKKIIKFANEMSKNRNYDFFMNHIFKFKSFIMEEINHLSDLASIFDNKIVFSQIQINHLKSLDIDVFVKEKIKNSQFTFFLEKEIKNSFINVYMNKFQSDMIALKKNFEELFYKMKTCSVNDFLKDYLELNSKKDLLSKNDILYYHYATSYYLTLINHFKEAYKRIEVSVAKIFKERKDFIVKSPVIDDKYFFYKVLNEFFYSEVKNIIQIKSTDSLFRFVNYLISKLDNEYNSPIEINIPIRFFSKIDNQIYRKKIVEVNRKYFKKISHVNKQYFFNQTKDTNFTYISSLIFSEDFIVYKELFHNYMTKQMKIKKDHVSVSTENLTVNYYDVFLFLELFDDQIINEVA